MRDGEAVQKGQGDEGGGRRGAAMQVRGTGRGTGIVIMESDLFDYELE